MLLGRLVGELPYKSYPVNVAYVKARGFVVNACTEGEGYRFAIRAAHTRMDGGRMKAAQLKRVFLPVVASAHCALARRPRRLRLHHPF